MTFSRSKRLIKAYEDCRGYYCGMGPAGVTPTRLRVQAYKHKGKLWFMLDVVNGVKK